MTPNDIRKFLKKYKIPVTAFSRMIGKDKTTVHRYLSGKLNMSIHVQKYIEIVTQGELKADDDSMPYKKY